VIWTTVLGQVVIVIVAVLGWLSTRRKVTEIHMLVNNQLDRQLKYNQELAAALTAAGQPVPPQAQAGSGEAGERLAPARREDPGVGPGR
jgi:hypothetical protein